MTAAYTDTLKAAVRLITGDSEYDVIWRDEETGVRKPEHVELTLIANKRIGVDEVRTTAVSGTLVETISGNRTLVIQFFCESDAQPLGAQTLADDLQIGLQRQDVRELLSTSNLGGVSLGPCMNASYTDDDGDRIAAVMFEAAFPTTQTRQGATIVRVKTVEASGTVDKDLPTETAIGPVTVTHDET